MEACAHINIRCLNEYELIRKYQCESCGAVMMCSCDERAGRKFLPHQLGRGVESKTQRRIPVTAGFQTGICRHCRGLAPKAHPKAEGFGRASKLRRYYWRELAFQTIERLHDWELAQEPTGSTAAERFRAQKEIETVVLRELELLHRTTPKYTWSEESQEEIVQKYAVQVDTLKATYALNPVDRRVNILDGSAPCTAEEYAARHFRHLGYHVLFTESVPFHALFGAYMWLLIQDFADPYVRPVSFGDRQALDQRVRGEMVWTSLPDDFGTEGYAIRRAAEIEEHLSPNSIDPDQLSWLFEYWLEPSKGLRQYLWAHRDAQIEIARKLIEVLPPSAILNTLRYLVGNYWGRYLGWPDLLVYRDSDFFFAEVKSSGDKLRGPQKRWIKDNHDQMHFPFRLVKIQKVRGLPAPQERARSAG